MGCMEMGSVCSKNTVSDLKEQEKSEDHIVDVSRDKPSISRKNAFQGLISPIYFVNFRYLLTRESFPRNPDDEELVTTVEHIDMANSLLVFISHSWSRGWSGARGWNGKPHPDTIRNEKLSLCKRGIKKLWQELAPECKNCYIWFDFSCINQDRSPCDELKQLDKIIQFCDCIFTPIVEDEKEDEDALSSENRSVCDVDVDFIHGDSDEIAKHYKSVKWNGDEHAYLNRGWTRIEMFYASAIPFLAQTSEETFQDKASKFKAGLYSAVKQGRRPQFVYGSYQLRKHLPMRVLPPLLHSYFHRYNPMNGNLSVPSDRKKISQLVEDLMPYLNFAVESYDGGLVQNKKEGFGKCTYKNGDVYEGNFVADERCGQGTYLYCDGSKYEGSWKGNKENGWGVFTYACGDVYSGEMLNGQFHGRGEIVSIRGKRLKGEFFEDKFLGEGRMGADDDNPFPGFQRSLSVCDNIQLNGFDRELSCSSRGSEFDRDLSVCDFDVDGSMES